MFVTTRVPFVVVNWGEAEATALRVESIKALQAAAEFELIIVDDGIVRGIAPPLDRRHRQRAQPPMLEAA